MASLISGRGDAHMARDSLRSGKGLREAIKKASRRSCQGAVSFLSRQLAFFKRSLECLMLDFHSYPDAVQAIDLN
jgi:hypothetical protein